MRISDWSSDVCSSDLVIAAPSPSPKAAHSARIFALQSEAAPGCRLIAAGAGFALSANKTALSASSASSLAFTDGLLRPPAIAVTRLAIRSEEHTSELQSLMRISYAVFCLKKQTKSLTHS